MTSVAANSWLFDTGPLVALLSSNDAAHESCLAAFESFRGHLVTTEAVVTEAMHLLRRSSGAQRACADFLLQGGAVIVPIDAKRLSRCRDLMIRYADVPMDFADATLVALAEELHIGAVFSLDRRGFSAYRWRKIRRFTLVPA